MPRGIVKNNRAMSQHRWRLTAECDTNRGRQPNRENRERDRESPAKTTVILG